MGWEEMNILFKTNKANITWKCLRGNESCNYFNMLLDIKEIIFYQVTKNEGKECMTEVFKGMQKMYKVINISCRLWCGYTFMFIHMPSCTAEDCCNKLKI